jgi:high frequency lysogenization protein
MSATEALDNRIIALAGLYQSVDLVSQIAWRGVAEPAPFEVSLASLFKVDADSYADVFGGAPGLKAGLHVLHAQLTDDDKQRQLERTRYAVTLLHLENKLRRNRFLTEVIQQGIAEAHAQLAHFELTHINVISRLADVYQRSISRLRPAVVVRGDQSYLTNPDNVSRVRALLLAGIRAAVLWRQAGGTRWRLLFGRQTLLHAVDRLLAELRQA